MNKILPRVFVCLFANKNHFNWSIFKEMKFLLLVIFIISIHAHVSTFSDSNLKNGLKKKEFTFIMFYPPYWYSRKKKKKKKPSSYHYFYQK